jgi:protein required for attachment to host cells
MKEDIWILSADTHKARIFCARQPHSQDIVEIKDFVQPETAMRAQDLQTDNLGRFSQGGAQQHSSRVPQTSLKEKNTTEFARKIAHYLEAEHKKGNFQNLGLIAAPDMLGELRAHLSPALTKDISFSLDKNVTQLNAQELRGHLPDKLAAARL